MTDRLVGHRIFVDGTRRPVYVDSIGQYILNEEGKQIRGVHLVPKRLSLAAHPIGILILALTCCCVAAILSSLIGMAQVLSWNYALANFRFAAILGLILGALGAGPVTIAGLIVSSEGVMPTVVAGSVLVAFVSWLVSFAITAMVAA
jgi:hypothetical protein